ncbi:hypothetical protein RMN56_03140 [Micromonospora halotolerans]|uniref:Uncharacterized protein n=1 Tax=Micromonospora halotolerans TaxID=709879 RepID=A0ABY9ZYX7_9ACTN|nr:hypothetical protein [Micromonospora halotolerans]WNM40367.1 hypothetical protein RMN56_03140 [Micromonospora halotolerans]
MATFGAPLSRRRRLGAALLGAGLLAVLTTAAFPAWHTVYPDRVALRPGSQLLWIALPWALVCGLVAVVSLARVGPSRSLWRDVSRGLLISTVLGGGALTAAWWYLSATDSYRIEDGMLSTGPGAGTLLALLGCLLVPLAGALPDDPSPARGS